MSKTNKTKRKNKVVATRNVNTFSYISSVSKECLERAESKIEGQNLMLSASMVFSAFKVEAFLNHLGSMKIPFWMTIERKLSPIEKLEVISKYLGITLDLGKRPFQTLKRMFRFRDSLAHGKSQELFEKTIQDLEEDESPTVPLTYWEKEISIETAKLYLEDSKKITVFLSENANIELSHLVLGSYYSLSATQI